MGWPGECRVVILICVSIHWQLVISGSDFDAKIWTRAFKKSMYKLPSFTGLSKCLLRKEQGVGLKPDFPSL